MACKTISLEKWNRRANCWLPENKRSKQEKYTFGTSLVVQWLRIHLPLQGTRVRALVREDPTCRGATKPMRHNYWAYALEPVSHNYWSPCAYSPCSTTREASAMRSPRTAMKSSPCSLQLEKACVRQRRPNTAKNKLNKFKKKYMLRETTI